MNLIAQLAWEFRLQQRYYFFITALVISAVWILLLFSLDEAVKSRWLPVLIYADLSTIGLLFIAGCLYLERRQGTLYALAITPRSRAHWLLLKLLSLSLLTSACAIAIVAFGNVGVNWLFLLPAILFTALLFTLLGFLLALPVDNILNYFLLLTLALPLLNLPLFGYFDIYAHWLFWLLPTMPAFQLLTLGFQSPVEAAPAPNLLLAVLWMAVLYQLSAWQFARFIAMRPQS